MRRTYRLCHCFSSPRVRRIEERRQVSPKKPNPEIIQKLKQAAVYLQREHLPQAESLLRGVLMAEPGNPDAFHLMGGVSLRRGRLDEAAALFDRSAEAGCSDPGLHIRLGVTRRALGQAEMAEAAFARAAGLARHLAGPALAQFARMLMSSGRPAESAALSHSDRWTLDVGLQFSGCSPNYNGEP